MAKIAVEHGASKELGGLQSNSARYDSLSWVNNAGVYEFMPLEQVTEQQFHRMFDTNVLGMLLVDSRRAEAFQCERRRALSTSVRSPVL